MLFAILHSLTTDPLLFLVALLPNMFTLRYSCTHTKKPTVSNNLAVDLDTGALLSNAAYGTILSLAPKKEA